MEYLKSTICRHCGLFMPGPNPEKNRYCRFCGYPLEVYTSDVPLDEIDSWTREQHEQFDNNVFENIIKKDPEFSEEAMEQRIATEEREHDEWLKKLEEKYKKGMGIVKCPYCGSDLTRKISMFERGLWSVALGIGSPALGKQWHCNNCGSKF